MTHCTLSLVIFFAVLFVGTLGDESIPVPPQPSQYTTSILLNGMSGMYYADTTIQRDRMDVTGAAGTIITDFVAYKQYLISPGKCEWAIVGPISPLLRFPSYKYDRNDTFNGTSFNQWSGCHQYEVPPAPFVYQATVRGSVPMSLDLPTIKINIQFFNFTFSPPPSALFEIPKECNKFVAHPKWHPILSRRSARNDGVDSLC